MIGQAILGQTCAWCQLPATTSVAIEQAVYKANGIVTPTRYAPACDDHAQIVQRQGDAPPRRAPTAAEGEGLRADVADRGRSDERDPGWVTA